MRLQYRAEGRSLHLSLPPQDSPRYASPPSKPSTTLKLTGTSLPYDSATSARSSLLAPECTPWHDKHWKLPLAASGVSLAESLRGALWGNNAEGPSSPGRMAHSAVAESPAARPPTDILHAVTREAGAHPWSYPCGQFVAIRVLGLPSSVELERCEKLTRVSRTDIRLHFTRGLVS